jgi:hypothetical protein
VSWLVSISVNAFYPVWYWLVSRDGPRRRGLRLDTALGRCWARSSADCVQERRSALHRMSVRRVRGESGDTNCLFVDAELSFNCLLVSFKKDFTSLWPAPQNPDPRVMRVSEPREGEERLDVEAKEAS